MALRYKTSDGKIAIYDKSSGDLPLTTPLSHLSKIKFHSDLDYIKVIDVRTVTISLPARSNFRNAVASYTLFAHDQPGQPFVLGKLNVNGVPVGFTGSVPVHNGYTATMANAGYPSGYLGRWLALGADASNVIVHEYCVASWVNASINETYPAMSIPVTVYVTDELL